LVGVCILSAAVGTGTTLLLAEHGPPGPRGERGPEGPPGRGAEEALSRTEDLDWRLDELESDISRVSSLLSEFGVSVPAVSSGELRELEAATEEVCVSLDLSC
jgi:hypothetical protein